MEEVWSRVPQETGNGSPYVTLLRVTVEHINTICAFLILVTLNTKHIILYKILMTVVHKSKQHLISSSLFFILKVIVPQKRIRLVYFRTQCSNSLSHSKQERWLIFIIPSNIIHFHIIEGKYTTKEKKVWCWCRP